MHIVIAYLGLDRDCEQRLRITTHLLRQDHIEAEVVPWFVGVHCQVLVIAAQDPEAAQALSFAQSTAIPVIVLSEQLVGQSGPSEQPVPSCQHLNSRALVSRYVSVVMTAIQSTQDMPQTSVLQRGVPEPLAATLFDCMRDCPYQGQDVRAQCHDLDFHICPAQHKVRAADGACLSQAVARFTAPGWQVTPLARGAQRLPPQSIWITLDSFWIRCVMTHADVLPAMPEGRFQLSDWPDLGGAPDQLHALKVASTILYDARSIAEIVVQTGMSAAQVSGCLWGFHLCGVLQRSEADETLVTVAEQAGAVRLEIWSELMSGIARKFGLKA